MTTLLYRPYFVLINKLEIYTYEYEGEYVRMCVYTVMCVIVFISADEESWARRRSIRRGALDAVAMVTPSTLHVYHPFVIFFFFLNTGALLLMFRLSFRYLISVKYHALNI